MGSYNQICSECNQAISKKKSVMLEGRRICKKCYYEHHDRGIVTKTAAHYIHDWERRRLDIAEQKRLYCHITRELDPTTRTNLQHHITNKEHRAEIEAIGAVSDQKNFSARHRQNILDTYTHRGSAFVEMLRKRLRILPQATAAQGRI